MRNLNLLLLLLAYLGVTSGRPLYVYDSRDSIWDGAWDTNTPSEWNEALETPTDEAWDTTPFASDVAEPPKAPEVSPHAFSILSAITFLVLVTGVWSWVILNKSG